MVSSSKDKKKILIVDDEKFFFEIMELTFGSDYEVISAADGRTALEMIQADPTVISGVILDQNLPEMSGLEVLKALNKENLTHEVPVFMLTGETDLDFIKECYLLGAMDFISKPPIPEILRKRVDTVIELFESRKEMMKLINKQSEIIVRQKEELYIKAQEYLNMSIGMVESISAIVEFRDVESGEHIQRMRLMVRSFLQNTKEGKKYTDEQIELISLASVLHDIGKISVTDSILRKPGRLTKAEFIEMRKHTLYGRILLDRIKIKDNLSFYDYARDIVYYHHERWDGNGYPEGLKGDEIPFTAQIVSIIDVYDALTNDRVYKAAVPPEKALAMMKNGECGAFNPELMEEFLEFEPRIREELARTFKKPESKKSRMLA